MIQLPPHLQKKFQTKECAVCGTQIDEKFTYCVICIRSHPRKHRDQDCGIKGIPSQQ